VLKRVHEDKASTGFQHAANSLRTMRRTWAAVHGT
jgi:hypothetical protein